MKRLKSILIVTLATVLGSSAFALKDEPTGSGIGKKPIIVSQAKGAGCAPASYFKILSFNNVSARLETGGILFYDRNGSVSAQYIVPKAGNARAIYAASLWMGGLDVNGNLKLAAMKFGTSGRDFWPGPLTTIAGTGNYNPNVISTPTDIRDYGDANISAEECLAYDQIWTVSKANVISYILWWECQPGHLPTLPQGCDQVTPPTNEALAQINAWPGNGDPVKGQDKFLAPFYDTNDDGVYDPSITPEGGDYPWFDDILGRDDVPCQQDRRVTLFGDQTNWWVFNDKGNVHGDSGGEPIGMEIRAQAFAFATDDAINSMTFYNYELINRGTQTLFDTYFAQYMDPDLGNAIDDYAGCDVSRGLSYVYNSNPAFDATIGSSIGYGDYPPAVGVDYFEGPYQDPDNKDNIGPFTDSLGVFQTPTVAAALADDGIVYKGLGIGYKDGIDDNERFGMKFFATYLNSGDAVVGDPGSAAPSQFYNYLQGLWRNGADVFYGSQTAAGAPATTAIKTSFMYPYDSDPLHWATGGVDPGFVWSQADLTGYNTLGQTAGAGLDMRFVQSAGPFTLKPGASNNLTIGIVYGRSVQGEQYSSVNAMRTADTKAQALFDNCFEILDPPNAPVLEIQELENELVLMISNPGNSNNFGETYSAIDKINILDPLNGTPYTNLEKTYFFEGYQIYQMSDKVSGITDLDDPTKARLVAQCDIKNEATRLINFEYDENLSLYFPVEKVNGSNEGIKHSFRVTEDFFSTGANKTLVNHKKYYYVAVAYGYNNYKDYDQSDPGALDGQKMPYLRSRINADGTSIEPKEALPHDPTFEGQGLIQQSVYGDVPEITRLDGAGNDFNFLRLSLATENSIVANNSASELTYQRGAGPIGVKVVDPLNVVGGYFECKFRNYPTGGIDTSDWVVYRYASKGGALIDSATSEVSIKTETEQLILKWGVSISIAQPSYVVKTGSGTAAERTFIDPIGVSLEYGDSTKPWLSFVPDDASFAPTNWLTSGTYGTPSPAVANPGLPWEDPNIYGDRTLSDPDLGFSKLLNGGVAPARLVRNNIPFAPLALHPTLSTPATNAPWQKILATNIPNVDLVITNDKTKWTRSAIVELGSVASFNEGGQAAGRLRKRASVDKDGNPDASGTEGQGWFPGYAIDVNSGDRLQISFGENSSLAAANGRDMLWNPTSTLYGSFGVTDPIFGGQHPVYIYTSNVNIPKYDPLENSVHTILSNPAITSANIRDMYVSMGWVVYPLLTEDRTVLETDVRILMRGRRKYSDVIATGLNGGKPMYSWNMDALETLTASNETLAKNIDNINVVPNPYYAFSEYERNRLDSKVKIVNLPTRCTVTIFNSSGKMIRQYKKDSDITNIEWDLKNKVGIPIASGVYIIHVDIPDVGEKIIKFYGGMRQIDLQGI